MKFLLGIGRSFLISENSEKCTWMTKKHLLLIPPHVGSNVFETPYDTSLEDRKPQETRSSPVIIRRQNGALEPLEYISNQSNSTVTPLLVAESREKTAHLMGVGAEGKAECKQGLRGCCGCMCVCRGGGMQDGIIAVISRQSQWVEPY